MADERVTGDARVDEVQGIDRSEQSGLGGDSSVLEEYGEDIERDDLPEPEDPAEEPILPGSDEVTDDPARLDAEAREEAAALEDQSLPRHGHGELERQSSERDVPSQGTKSADGNEYETGVDFIENL